MTARLTRRRFPVYTKFVRCRTNVPAPTIYHQFDDVAAMIPSPIPAPQIDLSFPHRWQAEILARRPLILPPRHFVYPRAAEEIERGALEVLVRPSTGPDAQPDGSDAQPFLATCALGFRDPAAPSGLWSAPEPAKICAVAGGYAYLIDTMTPERFDMIPYRPVLEIRPLMEENLLLFVGHHSILAWGRDGQAWESEKLSDEGLTITGTDGGVLRGTGWEMIRDCEKPFAIDLRSGVLRSLG